MVGCLQVRNGNVTCSIHLLVSQNRGRLTYFLPPILILYISHKPPHSYKQDKINTYVAVTLRYSQQLVPLSVCMLR